MALLLSPINGFIFPGPTAKKYCKRGVPVSCGQEVRFEHLTTGRNLHSHHFTSPLSNSQEVSAFGEQGIRSLI